MAKKPLQFDEIGYYLYFASPKAVAAGIVEDIFADYASRGAV